MNENNDAATTGDGWEGIDELLSEAPPRVKTLSINPIFAASAGTKLPICAMSTMRAV
jgi:hypothetical protein